MQTHLIDGPLARMFRAMLEKAEADNRHWDNLALFHFTALIANHYDLPASAILDEIEVTPPSFLDNARNPQGLTAIASYLAAALGADDRAALLPTVH